MIYLIDIVQRWFSSSARAWQPKSSNVQPERHDSASRRELLVMQVENSILCPSENKPHSVASG